MSKEKSVEVPSWRLDTGELVEMIYDPEKRTSIFAVAKPGSEDIQFFDQLQYGDKVLKPISPDNAMLKLGFIRVASKVEFYESEKKLFGMIKHYINTYVALPPDFVTVAAVYIMFTWIYDRFSIVPYLRVIGSFGSGKTRFLTIVGNLLYKSIFFGGSTSTAGIYRTLDFIKGSMVFDETDFKHSDMAADIIKVLNQGHDTNFPVVKMEPKRNGGYETKTFQVFGPKVFASRERFNDEALESRCVTQRLHNNQQGSFPIVLSEDHNILARMLRSKLLAFRFLNYEKVTTKEVDLPNITTPRIKQTFMALASVAKLIDDEVFKVVLDFGLKSDRELKSQLRNSIEVDVIICLLEMLYSHEKNEAYKKIYIQQLADKFHDKFYDDYSESRESAILGHKDKDGKPIFHQNYKVSAKKLGGIISKLGLRKDRDGGGFYIPATEYPRIFSLQEYYGITKEMFSYFDIYENDENTNQ